MDRTKPQERVNWLSFSLSFAPSQLQQDKDEIPLLPFRLGEMKNRVNTLTHKEEINHRTISKRFVVATFGESTNKSRSYMWWLARTIWTSWQNHCKSNPKTANNWPILFLFKKSASFPSKRSPVYMFVSFWQVCALPIFFVRTFFVCSLYFFPFFENSNNSSIVVHFWNEKARSIEFWSFRWIIPFSDLVKDPSIRIISSRPSKSLVLPESDVYEQFMMF